MNSFVSVASPNVNVAVNVTSTSVAPRVTVPSVAIASLLDAHVITTSFNPVAGNVIFSVASVTSNTNASLASANFSASVG